MNQFKTNNKIFNSVLEPIILHLQKSNYNMQSFDVLFDKVKEIEESLEPTKALINLNVFYESLNNVKVRENITPVDWQNLLSILYKALIELDSVKTNKIIGSISDCQNQLENLESTVNIKYVLSWFKEFCKNICTILSLSHKRTFEVNTENCKNIFLYIIQLTTCTKLFLKLFSDEISNQLILIESRRFLKKRFIYIFDGFKKVLSDTFEFESNFGFIQWMDNTLDLISNLKPNKRASTEEIKSSLEEVLCHAMSIAQISSSEDSKRIKASIQTILVEFKQLQNEFDKSVVNSNLGNLHTDIVSDKLCLLEKRINTAVLNISLKVFSDPLEPLKKLQNVCEESDESILKRSENDLDDLIQNLDLHVDCIIQVGLFAVACSTNIQIIAKIRSHLASLESLECELIPALTSLYLEPSKTSFLYANFLIKHWTDEIQQLTTDVCFIIDPVAFGQVVHDEYKISLDKLEENAEINEDNVIVMCKNVKVLIVVAECSAEDMKLNKDSIVFVHIKHLKDVHREVLAATKQLKNDQNYFNRIIKRLKVLSTMINRIINAFSQENSTISSEKSSHHQNNETIEDLNLNSYKKRGLEILKDRSGFYKTPNRTRNKLNLTTKLECRKLGNTFLRDVSQNFKQNQSMDLQITEILEELTNLADTIQ